MKQLFDRLKILTGCYASDLANQMKVTRQYASLLLKNPSKANNKRLGRAMQEHIWITIQREKMAHQKLMGELQELYEDIDKTIRYSEEKSA